MKLFYKGKDGGPKSTVTGYWLIESKRYLSIALLKFEGKSREAYHSHAFDCINWVLKGKLKEERLLNSELNIGEELSTYHEYPASLKPFAILREDFHKVDSDGTSWVFTIRGPWAEEWKEKVDNVVVKLTFGRQVVH